MCAIFSPTSQLENQYFLNIQISIECPIFKFNCDTNHLEVMSDFTSLRTQSHKVALRRQVYIMAPPGTHTSVQLATKPGFPQPSPRFDNLLEWLTKLMETFTYICQLIIKDLRKHTH